ncbi:MAG: putative bifunctional diguanylate cyclase/phosphodiesterase [Acidiferrobacterales bacterium]
MRDSVRILFVDDNSGDCALAIQELRRDYPTVNASQVRDASAFAQSLENDVWDAVIIDYHLDWSDGLKVFHAVKERWASCAVIMFTGSGNEEIAVEAMKSGLDDYVIKSPPDFGRLRTAVRMAFDRKRRLQVVSDAESRYRGLFQDVPVGLYRITPFGGIIEANPAIVQMLGFKGEEALRAVNAADLCAAPDMLREWLERLQREGEVRDVEFRMRRSDGEMIWVRNSARAVVDSSGHALFYDGMLEDITARKEAEEQLSFLANHDALTGLPNRSLFNDRLSQAVIEADRRERLVGVIFLDLDHFKNINDTLGHEAGDELLRSVAQRLLSNVRHGDTVARLSGDEFALVLAGMVHVDDAARVAQKLIDCFAAPFRAAGHELFVSPSIGITLFPFDDSSIEGLLKNADIAMYRAKEQGRNTYQFYAAEMTSEAFERLSMEGDLRRALDRSEFLLHYQPVVSLDTGEVLRVEALIRWQHPQRGLIMPAQFIPLAEDTGLIGPIGEWALQTACSHYEMMRHSGAGAPRMAVNLSARQFRQPGLARAIEEALGLSGMNPDELELELTESMLMHNVDIATSVLRELSGMGVQLCIDDFGMGYSSLSYLKRFPIDWLKVDRSFVHDITTDPDDAAIVTAIIAMAHSLDIRVTAEGVENESEAAFLRSRGCDAMQGYLVSRPLDAGDLAVFLRPRRDEPGFRA